MRTFICNALLYEEGRGKWQLRNVTTSTVTCTSNTKLNKMVPYVQPLPFVIHWRKHGEILNSVKKKKKKQTNKTRETCMSNRSWQISVGKRTVIYFLWISGKSKHYNGVTSKCLSHVANELQTSTEQSVNVSCPFGRPYFNFNLFPILLCSGDVWAAKCNRESWMLIHVQRPSLELEYMIEKNRITLWDNQLCYKTRLWAFACFARFLGKV